MCKEEKLDKHFYVILDSTARQLGGILCRKHAIWNFLFGFGYVQKKGTKPSKGSVDFGNRSNMEQYFKLLHFCTSL